MDIDQANYLQKVRRVEIDKVKASYGGVMMRMRIIGDSERDGSTLSFSIWGEFNPDTLERIPVELVIRELDETKKPEPTGELVEEEPDV